MAKKSSTLSDQSLVFQDEPDSGLIGNSGSNQSQHEESQSATLSSTTQTSTFKVYKLADVNKNGDGRY